MVAGARVVVTALGESNSRHLPGSRRVRGRNPAALAAICAAAALALVAPARAGDEPIFVTGGFEDGFGCPWSAFVPAPSTCSDAFLNGCETDLDCGGGQCGGCEDFKDCFEDSDCLSHLCVGAVCVQCATANDCSIEAGECEAVACTSGVCGVDSQPYGTELADQVMGDCSTAICDGSGGTTMIPDNLDLPADDGFECTSESCLAGVPTFPPLPAGSACSEGGGSVCDGAGTCVECNAPVDCPGEDSTCAYRTCTLNTCGVDFAPTDTPCEGGGSCDGAGICVPPG